MPAKRLSLATVAWGLCAAATVAADSRMPSFTAAGLVNAASGQTVLAPYSICSLYGTGLLLNGAVTATGHNEMPYSLAGVTVLFGTIPAGLFYVSPSQINLLVPNSLTPGSYSITIIRDGLASQPVAVNLQEVAPGLFASPPDLRWHCMPMGGVSVRVPRRDRARSWSFMGPAWGGRTPIPRIGKSRARLE